MKRLLYIAVAIMLLLLVACNSPTNKKGKTITVYYYDAEEYMIDARRYTDHIDLIDYELEEYRLEGWYLDKEFTNKFDSNKENEYFKNDTLELYAKMERAVMQDFNIINHGIIDDNKTILNPAFTWTNSNDDNSYLVTLKSGEKVIEEKEVDNPSYKVKKLLSKDTDYELSVVGKRSNYKTSINFKTITEYSNNISKIELANPFANGMVIQRDKEIEFMGKGPQSQQTSVIIGEDVYYGISDEDGYFSVKVPARSASFDPISITITNNINCFVTLTDVLFGDVYLFAGQSNMQWPTQSSDYSADDIEELMHSNVRFFCQDVVTSTTKLDKVTNGRWFKPSSTNCLYFSAIATMTGAFLSKTLVNEVPIGIVTAYQGDTNIANWMDPEYYQGNVSTKYLHYNAMVYPLRGTKLSGVVWYQGCNNSAAGCEYKDLLLDLFANYRDLFNSPNAPFFVIGLACYDGDSGNNFDFSFVRESQALACCEDDNAYFISICDDGDPTYIHPAAKRYICERVAKSMLGAIYNKNNYTEGPSYKSHTVEGNIVTISLNNSAGLVATGEIKGLYLAGEDGKYHEATARIVGDAIVASSDKVASPVYIKYGFAKSPFVNIFNKDGFAITPFRTAKYDINTDLFEYDSIENYRFHQDGSKMELSLKDGNLEITKTDDGKGYGSVILDKWGAISYEPKQFRLTIKGTNSGASIAIRAVEGETYEIWGYKIIDNFEGLKTFEISMNDFSVMGNKKDEIFDPQKILYVEIMVEKAGEATFELCEARFVDAN